MNTRKSWLISIILLFVLLVSACGAPATPAPTEASAVPQPVVTEAPPAATEAAPIETQPVATEAPTEAVQATEPPVVAEKTLVVAYDTSSMVTLDPARSFELPSFFMIHHVYETLLGYEGDDWINIVPKAAESFNISSDGLEYTFVLRQNNVFASGNKMTAEDIRWSFERIRNLKGNPAFYMDNVKEVVVVDPLTVKMVLNTPDSSMLATLSGVVFSIVDSKLAIENGASAELGADQSDTSEAWFNQHPAGSGPYVLTSWIKNTELILDSNPNYRLPQPRITKVIIKHVAEPATQRLMLENGDVDVAMNLGPDLIPALKNEPGITVVPLQTMEWLYIAMTASKEKNVNLADNRVRQAIASSINYDEMLVLMSADIRAASVVPVGLLGAEKDWTEANKPREDLEKAKALLTEAGYPDGFKIKMRTFTGVSPQGISFELVAQKLQQDLARVGIEVELELVEPSVLWTSYRGKEESFLLVYDGVDQLDPNNLDFKYSGGQAARLYWEPTDVETMNRLRKEGITETVPAKRAEIYHQLQEILLKEGPYIQLPQMKVYVCTRDNVTGYIYAPIYVTDFYLIDKK